MRAGSTADAPSVEVGVPARVVVADADDAMRRSVTQSLEGDGRYEVLGETADVGDAVELVRRHHPDAVVLGAGLGGATASGVARRLRSLLPVAVITVIDNPEALQRDGGSHAVDACYPPSLGPGPLVRELSTMVADRRADAGARSGGMAPVLLLEDDAVAAAVTMDLLSGMGLVNPVVHHADTGPLMAWLAEDVDAGRRPALVLLDMLVPSGTGLEVLRWIRERPALEGVPVVMLTGRAELEEINEAYRLGLSSYLVKPVGFDALAATIHRLHAPWALLEPPATA